MHKKDRNIVDDQEKPDADEQAAAATPREVQLGDTVLFTFHDAEMTRPQSNVGQSATVPAMVVAKWSPDCVNLKLVTDGPSGFLWRTSVERTDEPGVADHWAFCPDTAAAEAVEETE
jgi:hypothetical protein